MWGIQRMLSAMESAVRFVPKVGGQVLGNRTFNVEATHPSRMSG